MTVMDLPAINASLNALAALFLLLGWRSIKAQDRKSHQRFMTTAFFCSMIFLACYLTYHYLRHGLVTKYQGQGITRIIYFTILGTHTPLAVLIVPFSLMAVWHATRGNFTKHVQITRWLLPVWLYVSVTGVLIYLMLYVWK